jgi:hypothetical protein
MAEAEMTELVLSLNPEGTPEDFLQLVERCYRSDKPAPKDLALLRAHLDRTPELYRAVADLARVARDKLTDGLIEHPAMKAALEANVEVIKAGLGWAEAPLIEQILIDDVVNCWLRLRWVEFRHAEHTSGAHSMSEGDYWSRAHSAAQRRHLRAVETLARVRKLTRATLQINIAQPGSQQLNVAGDLVSRGRSE